MPSVRAKAIANLACVMEREELLRAVSSRGREEKQDGWMRIGCDEESSRRSRRSRRKDVWG
eukprot:203883-Hanusia_phi.AAC.1